MHIKYLILCACCALLISLILPRIFVGYAGLTDTLGIVTIFAIISSYCIAYYYDDAMKKAAIRNVLTTNSVGIPEALLTDNKEAIQLTWPQPSQQTQLKKCLTAKEPIEQSNQAVADSFVVCISATQNVILADESDNILQINNAENIVEDTKVISESAAKNYLYPMKYEEGNKDSIVLKNNIIQQTNTDLLINNTVGINIISTPLILGTIHKHVDAPILNEPINSYPSSNDLDSLIDLAFSQKEQGNFRQAQNFFSKALRLYPDSEVSPLLVMEVGTILKDLGSYDKALEVFTEGRLLPGVINNSTLKQDFINNIAYLRIVKNILVKNSLHFMPYHDIPENVFNEIDSEFCEWRNQS